MCLDNFVIAHWDGFEEYKYIVYKNYTTSYHANIAVSISFDEQYGEVGPIYIDFDSVWKIVERPITKFEAIRYYKEIAVLLAGVAASKIEDMW